MKFTVLGSGSTGNAVLISTEKTNVLVDAGLSAKELLRRMNFAGIEPSKLDAILITHEHSDHAGGLRVLLRSVNCPVYISKKTEESYYLTKRGIVNGDSEAAKRHAALKDRTVAIDSESDFCIGDIDFEPFGLPHDAADNFGFVAKFESLRIATLMDFGHFTDQIKEKLIGCDAIIIESNHSRDMLRACQVYSWDLKQRIASPTGHISNEQVADWLTDEFDGTARQIVLTHLSQRANDPHLAKITAETALITRSNLHKSEAKIIISDPKTPTDWIKF